MYVVLKDLLFHQLKNAMGMNALSFKCHKHPRHLSSRKDCRTVWFVWGFFTLRWRKLHTFMNNRYILQGWNWKFCSEDKVVVKKKVWIPEAHTVSLYNLVLRQNSMKCTTIINSPVFILTAVLVGNTQSNISTPRAQHTTRSVAKPTPIRYRGLSSGSMSVVRCTILQKSSLLSPPLKGIIQTLRLPLYQL